MNCPLTLSGPMILARFNAWVEDPVPQGCSQPASNLGCFGSGGLWNYVQIGGPALENDAKRWGTIKSLYR